MKDLDGECESEIRIGGAKQRVAGDLDARSYDNSSRLGLGDLVEIFGIRQKREIAGRGIFHPSHAGDFDLGRPFDLAARPPGDFTKPHAVTLSCRYVV